MSQIVPVAQAVVASQSVTMDHTVGSFVSKYCPPGVVPTSQELAALKAFKNGPRWWDGVTPSVVTLQPVHHMETGLVSTQQPRRLAQHEVRHAECDRSKLTRGLLV